MTAMGPPPSSSSSSNTQDSQDTVDSEQRILDQYPRAPPGQGRASRRESRETLFKGRKNSVVSLKVLRRSFPELYRALLLLSRRRLLYIGLYGYGATKAWKYQGFKEGTFALLDRIKEQEQLPEIEYDILDNLAQEGTVFASYDSLMEYLREKLQQQPQQQQQQEV